MKRWISFLGHLVIIIVILGFAKNVVSVEYATVPNTSIVGNDVLVAFPKQESSEDSSIENAVFLRKGFLGFKEAVAFKESQGNYRAINTLGYIGKYQFGASTLHVLGIHNTDNFLRNPGVQENVFELNVSRNKWILRREIKLFVGKRINGVVISESGIIAAAHLAGAGNVKKYLKSYGKNDFSDAYGSSVAYYMKKFRGYNISEINPIQNPRI